MPNTAQAKKRLRQDEKRRLLNKEMRSSMRSAMKRVVAADSKESGHTAWTESAGTDKDASD